MWSYEASIGYTSTPSEPQQVKVRVHRADSGAYLERTCEVSADVGADGNSKAIFRSLPG
jgi:hypothetical protein